MSDENIDLIINQCNSLIKKEDERSESVDNSKRIELLWDKNEETLMINFKNECYKKSNFHTTKVKKYKKLYIIFGIPNVLVPLISSSFISQLKDYLTISSVLFLLTAVLSGINNFFSFDTKKTLHLEYESKYKELGRDIEVELSKPKKNRQAASVYIEIIYQQLSRIDGSAPS